MKEGWEYKKLGEVIEHLRTGLNPRTHFKLNTSDAEGYYVTVRELKGFAIEPDEKTDKVNKSAIKRINERSNLKIGDVLFSGTGTIGKTALVTELPENWNIKEGVYAMTPKHSELDSKYFIYYIGSDLFLRLVNDKAAGTGVRSIPMKELVKLPISVPPLSEQQSIVDYLDSAFAKIDAMKANAEKALDEANALFQASLKEMLEPKEGWEETALKELGQTQTGTTPSKSDKVNYGDFMEFIRPSEIDCDGIGSINYNCEMKLSKQGASKGRIFNSNSIFMVCIGATIGKVGFSTKNISCNQQINVFTPKEKINYKFAYYAMKSPSFQHRVIKEGTSSQATLPIINKGKWEQLSICFPAIKEQEIIVSHLDLLSLNVLKLKTNYNKISQECDALKQAILKQVFE